MELCENSNRGAIPKKRDSMMERQVSTPPYVEVQLADDPLNYVKGTDSSSRRSLHDEVLRSALSIKNSLTVPVSSGMRRHSCNDTDAILDRAPFAPNLGRRNSVKRSPSVVSSRSRRGSKYYSGVERRASHLSGTRKTDYALAAKEGFFSSEEYRKEMRRRKIVWLVIGMFFFILAVSVLIVVITLTHHDVRRYGRYNCTC